MQQQIQTADTINKLFDLIKTNTLYEDVLYKYFPRINDRDEFRQELWLFFCEHPDRALTALNNNYFDWYYISIVKTQATKPKSKWNTKIKRPKELLLEDSVTEYIPTQHVHPNYDWILQTPEQIEEYAINVRANQIALVRKALNHYYRLDPEFKREGTVYEYYVFDKLSIREIQKRFHNISKNSIWQYIQYAKTLVEFYIRKHS